MSRKNEQNDDNGQERERKQLKSTALLTLDLKSKKFALNRSMSSKSASTSSSDELKSNSDSFREEQRLIRRFVHKGNRVGIKSDEEVVNKVGSVLQVGVRESLINNENNHENRVKSRTTVIGGDIGKAKKKIKFRKQKLNSLRENDRNDRNDRNDDRNYDDDKNNDNDTGNKTGNDIVYDKNVLPAFTFVSHKAEEFKKLREAFGLEECSYAKSFEGSEENNSKCKTSLRVVGRADAGGRSGAWFFCTEDSRCLLKTTKKSDMKVLLNNIDAYIAHVQANGKNTYIPQIYGCYSIKIGNARGPARYQTFLVMGYWFSTQLKVGSPRYDLKGSRCSRTAKENNGDEDDDKVKLLKDNNFVAHEERDCVRTLRNQTIVENLKRDADFLASLNLMDYSLLLGHHNMHRDALPTKAPKSKTMKFIKSLSMFNRATRQKEVSIDISRKDDDNQKIERTRTSPNIIELITDYNNSSNSESGSEPILIGDELRINQLRFARTPTGVAFFGIVDVLQAFTLRKKIEWFFKSALFCGARDVSCQPPHFYAKRFKTFIEEHVIKPREINSI